MRIGIGGSASTLHDIVAEARAAEAMGATTYSLSNVLAHDAIGALIVVATQTTRIELLTAVVPAFTRHPMALAQQAVTAQALAGGRFTLGIGVSQRPLIERAFGLSYERPVRHMREYLQVLQALLNGHPVRFDGDFYRVHGGLTVNDARPVACIIAALGPRMLRVGGELSDGTVLWLSGARSVARHIAPRIRRAAAEASRPAPRIVCGLPIVLTRDVDAARAKANELWGVYGRLPSYRAMLDEQGAATPGDVVLAGDDSALDAALQELEEAGVTTFLATPFAVDDGAVARTYQYLAAKASQPPGATWAPPSPRIV